MKIAFLNIYSGVNNRGAESFAHELARRLEEKHQVNFYTGQQLNTKIVQPEHSHQSLGKRLFIDPAGISVLIFSLKVFPILWKGKYDWVVPMNGFWQVLLCKVISLFQGTRILITGHSGPGWDERWNLYLKPDVFVATTEPTAKWAKKVSPWTKVVTIPYGIDIDVFSKAKPIKLNLERPIILCNAAAVEYKRVELAIKAVAKLSKGSLLHLGTGPLLSQIKDLGEKLLGEKRFQSLAVEYSEIPGYYAAVDLVTLPSSSQENSPMVFLESLAAGKFVVATDAPRPRWLLGEAGVLIDPENLAAYSQALQKAVGMKNEKIIQEQAKKYSWIKIIGEYERLLSSFP